MRQLRRWLQACGSDGKAGIERLEYRFECSPATAKRFQERVVSTRARGCVGSFVVRDGGEGEDGGSRKASF